MKKQTNIPVILGIIAISIILITGCGDDVGVNVNPAPAAGSTASVINGTVYDPEGNVLDGARIILTPLISSSENYGESQEVLSQNGGTFSFTIHYSGEYLIEARYGDTFLGSKEFTLTVGENLTINLGEPVTEADLTLYVWQNEEQTIPAVDFTVKLIPSVINTNGIEVSETSTGDGWVKFEDFPTGSYVLTVSYKEINEEKSILLTAGDNTENIVLYRWHEQYIDGVKILGSVFFTDSMNGWAVGSWSPSGGTVDFDDVAVIVRTEDGGKTWNDIQTFSETFRFIDIYFSDSQTGWVVGYEAVVNDNPSVGVVLKSTDGGKTWSNPQTISGTAGLYSVFSLDNQTGWAVGGRSNGSSGYDGVFIKTTDGGNTWSSPVIFGEDLMLSVFFADNMTGWIGGYSTILRKTTDGGDTWSELNLYVGAISSIYFSDKLHGWVSTGNSLIRTVDGGNSWEPPTFPANEVMKYSRLCFIDNMNGWVAGQKEDYYGLILQTKDGGISWSHHKTTILNEIKDIYFIDENTGWAVSWRGYIARYAPLAD